MKKLIVCLSLSALAFSAQAGEACNKEKTACTEKVSAQAPACATTAAKSECCAAKAAKVAKLKKNLGVKGSHLLARR
jgi:hypothetical protein